MQLAASPVPTALTGSRRFTARLQPPAVAAWTLAFTVVLHLALSNGGYDTVVRSQVGVAVWWIVLIGALAGVLPARIGRGGWLAIGLLAGFALWTGLAIGWSESAERSSIELGRNAAYAGVLVLAICLQGRAAARHTINGLACAIGLVTVLAVLSRLHPQWFPVNDHLEFLGAANARKLSYPLNYWNALACLAAIGVPLLLGVALGARTLLGQALAAAALPLSALCVYLTLSRGGTLALAVGVVVFLAFVPRRLPAVATLAVGGAGAAILIVGASQRDALQDGLVTPTATQQGSELIWLALVVCAGVALVQVALGLAARHLERPALLAPGRPVFAAQAGVALVVAGAVAVGAGAPGWASGQWREFTAPPGAVAAGAADDVFSRLSVVNGNGRFQLWQSGLDATASAPWTGIGPGTFEFWWARNGTHHAFVRDAHSLYLETLAETGIVGLALLGGLLALLAATAIVRSLRAPPALRVSIAAAAGGLAVFLTSAALEWVWEIAAIACAVLALGAVIVAGRAEDEVTEPAPAHAPRRGVAARAGLAVLAVAALGAVAVPMAGALATRDSRDAAAEGRLAAALRDSRTAQRIQPYAATPRLQQALVLEAAGALRRAASAARAAAAEEPTNWRPWFVLARISARRGQDATALAQLRRARRLNPRSPLLVAR